MLIEQVVIKGSVDVPQLFFHCRGYVKSSCHRKNCQSFLLNFELKNKCHEKCGVCDSLLNVSSSFPHVEWGTLDLNRNNISIFYA